MKKVTFNSRCWNAEKGEIEEHKISFNISNKTCESFMQDFSTGICPFAVTYVEGQDYEVTIEDTDTHATVLHAVRL